MFEKEKKFCFDVSETKKENCIFLRIHAVGMPSEPPPQILVDLLFLLEKQSKISSLIQDFPQYTNTLKILELVLSQGKATVIKKEKSELYYSNVYGYSIHVRVEYSDSSEKDLTKQSK